MSQSISQPKSPPVPPSDQSDKSRIINKFDIEYLIKALIKYNASDLHMKVGRPPLYRINGKLIPAKMPEFTQHTLESVINRILSPKQLVELELKRNIDLSFRAKDLGRFRCNIYFQRGTLSAAIRMIPFVIPSIESLLLPTQVLKELAQKRKGLILITGATGTGKSTTLAALVQFLNETGQLHILSIEDPIEFVFRDSRSTITQREVGSDTLSFKDAVISGLRQDPDVMVIGEMRDLETIQAGLTAAETGHLVITTLHTNDTKSAIERILDAFPSSAQNQVRLQLASTLIGVVSQQLLVRADGSGLIPACEVLVKSPVIENYILHNELDKIPEAISNSNTYYKMQTMNQAIEKLIHAGSVTVEEGLKASPNPDDLKMRLSGFAREEGFSR